MILIVPIIVDLVIVFMVKDLDLYKEPLSPGFFGGGEENQDNNGDKRQQQDLEEETAF